MRDLADGFAAAPGISAVRRSGPTVSLEVTDVVAATTAALAICAERSVVPSDLRTRRSSLDDVFLALTGRSMPADDPTPMVVGA